MSGFELGQKVRFTWVLHRASEAAHPPGASSRRLPRKVWRTEGWPGQPEPLPREGVIVGKRTLSDGEIDYGGYEDPVTYYPERHFTAWLVAFDLLRKPVLVLPQHIQAVEND
jgi:hypothetical protein